MKTFITPEILLIAENLIIAESHCRGTGDNSAVRKLARELDMDCHVLAMEQGWDEDKSFSVPNYQREVLHTAKAHIFDYFEVDTFA